MLSAYILDDELLAIERLSRLLGPETRLRVVGSSTDPLTAIG